MVNDDDLEKLTEKRRKELGIRDEDLEPVRVPKFEPARPPITPEQEQARQERIAADKMLRAQRDVAENLRQLFRGRERYAKCTLDNYHTETIDQMEVAAHAHDYETNLADMIRTGTNLVIFGYVGTGKDHLMSALLRSAVLAGQSVRWISGMELFSEVRDRMDQQKSESALLTSLTGPNVLAISDPLPPAGDLTPFQATMLFMAVDGRYARGLPTWVTMNVTDRAEAERRMGIKIVDRLTDNAVVLVCNWASYRRART